MANEFDGQALYRVQSAGPSGGQLAYRFEPTEDPDGTAILSVGARGITKHQVSGICLSSTELSNLNSKYVGTYGVAKTLTTPTFTGSALWENFNVGSIKITGPYFYAEYSATFIVL